MTRAVFRAMLLGLLRDRGALAMSFVVPAVFFLIFGAIFAATSGEDFRPRVTILDEARTPLSSRLVAVLEQSPSLEVLDVAVATADELRGLVRRGSADVALLIRPEGGLLGPGQGAPPAPLVILGDPSRGVAIEVLRGQIERAHATLFADLAPAAFAPRRLIERENVAGRSAGLNNIAYSAGAVAVLFMLLSAVQGAVSLFDERSCGILERLVAGPGGTDALVDGKFAFLVVQGAVQVAVIFLAAWLVYDVNVTSRWLAWLGITLAASASAAGLALAMVAACTSRRQALNFATVAVLILSALGGSMVPRFLMPPPLQVAGWLTPNAWALEAYTAVLWRDEGLGALVVPVGLLGATAVAGLILARLLTRRLAVLSFT